MFTIDDALDWETNGSTRGGAGSFFVDTPMMRWRAERSGAGPCALLIHGTGASAHSWAGLRPVLAEDWDVVAVDLPGHGFTRPKGRFTPTLANVAAALSQFVKALDVSPALIVGHSAGAAIMIDMIARAAATPIAAVSVNGALAPFEGPAAFVFPFMARSLALNPFVPHFFASAARDRRNVARMIEQTGSTIPPEAIDQYQALLSQSTHVAGALRMMAHWDLTQIMVMLGDVETPALFIAGENDKAVSPKISLEAAARAPAGEFKLMPGLGHLAHEEDPAAVAAQIRRFALDRA